MRGALLLACAALVACTRPEAADPAPDGAAPPSGAAEAAAAQEERVVGRLAVVGSAPVNVRVTVQPDRGGPVYLAGPLLGELRALGGARVELRGRRSGGELVVADYQVVSVDGRPVEMGTVERAPGGGLQLRRRDGGVVQLQGGVQQLRPGQKVWVQGPSSVTVQSYGIITGS